MKIEECFNNVLSRFQGCLKKVQWVFEEEFQRWFKDVSRKFLGYFKEYLGVFLETFKSDSRELLGI